MPRHTARSIVQQAHDIALHAAEKVLSRGVDFEAYFDTYTCVLHQACIELQEADLVLQDRHKKTAP